MNRYPPRRAYRGGYTLVEMLTVLALLAVLAAVAWPALRSSFRNHRLRDAAKVVRTELAKTRLRAIESGTPQQFRYQPGTGRFEIAPQAAAGADERRRADSPAAPVGREAATDDWAGALAALAPGAKQYDLPDGVSFSPPTDDEPADDASREESANDQGWSSPIVFQPNGRTSNARIRLFGEGSFRIDVILRGLTGVAIASELGRDEERR